MTRQADALAQVAMTPQELEAMAFADAYYGAEAKLEASKLLIGLGAGEDEATVIMLGLAAQLEIIDFSQKKEVAEHFKRLGELCGTVVLKPHVHLAPVPEPEAITPEVHLEIPNGSLDDADPDTAQGAELEDEPEPAEPHTFDALQKRFLINMFGEHNSEKLFGLSTEQFRYLLDTLGQHYVKLSIMRLNQHTKEMRRHQMMEYVFERQDAAALGERYGVSFSGVTQAIRKMIHSVQKRTTPEKLDAMVVAAGAYSEKLLLPADSTEPQEEKLLPQPEAPRKPEREITKPPAPKAHESETPEVRQIEEPKSLRRTVRELADFLHFSREESEQLVKLFDTEKRMAETSELAVNVRETIRSIYEVVTTIRRHNFTPLEAQAFDLLLLQTEPTTVRGVKSRMYEQLRIESRRIDEVLRSGIDKILEERRRVLKVGNSVITR